MKSIIPFCMDRLRIFNAEQSIEIPFGPSDGYIYNGHIPLTTIRLGKLELSVEASAAWPAGDEHGTQSRLDLFLVKNGEPFRLICNGPLLLCDEYPSAEKQHNKFWIQYGAWE